MTLSTNVLHISRVGMLPHDDWDLQPNFDQRVRNPSRLATSPSVLHFGELLLKANG
jgi:hypothetical protein